MSDHPALLRRAATKARETAQAAAPGPWHMDAEQRIYAEDGSYVTSPWTDELERDADLDHIALWHPGVALAVADWLESVADLHEETPADIRRLMGGGCQWCGDEDWPCADMRAALKTARALLNEPEEPLTDD